jgi:hypothetical protein
MISDRPNQQAFAAGILETNPRICGSYNVVFKWNESFYYHNGCRFARMLIGGGNLLDVSYVTRFVAIRIPTCRHCTLIERCSTSSFRDAHIYSELLFPTMTELVMRSILTRHWPRLRCGFYEASHKQPHDISKSPHNQMRALKHVTLVHVIH